MISGGISIETQIFMFLYYLEILNEASGKFNQKLKLYG